MQDRQNDITAQQAAVALAWLADMGADEIIGETAVNRLAATVDAPTTPKPATVSPAMPQAARPPAPRPFEGGGDAANLAAACQTLDDIAAALSRFDACPLKKTATNLCFADGNPKAHVMLVGEAPGRDEDIQGKPFVGRSGQLLDKMLKSIGLSRDAEDPEKAVFITNTVFWRPPGNRTPTEAETAMCLPFLLRKIEIQQPRFILCLGAVPALRLTGRTDGILKLRGKWQQAEVGSRRIPVLATLHPAYLLRQPGQKRLAWRDLLMVRQALDAH